MKESNVLWTPETLLAINYTPEQQAAIAAALTDIAADKSGFCCYSRSEKFIQCGKTVFVVFGHRARELPEFKDAEDMQRRYEYLPVVIEGQMIERAPEEGDSGLLHLMRCTHMNGQPYDNGTWNYVYLPTFWTYTNEISPD